MNWMPKHVFLEGHLDTGYLEYNEGLAKIGLLDYDIPYEIITKENEKIAIAKITRKDLCVGSEGFIEKVFKKLKIKKPNYPFLKYINKNEKVEQLLLGQKPQEEIRNTYISTRRYYILKGEIVYQASFDPLHTTKKPNQKIADTLVQKLNKNTDCPVAYTIDLGLNTQSETHILAVHDGFSLDAYGDLQPEIYFDILCARWYQIMQNKKK